MTLLNRAGHIFGHPPEIGGHTDNVETPAYNQTLSEKRAAAVKDWLVAHGVAASRLTSRGYGETRADFGMEILGPPLPPSPRDTRTTLV